METELGSGLGVACLLVGSVAEAEVLLSVRVRVKVSVRVRVGAGVRVRVGVGVGVKQHAVTGGVITRG